jgi:hypothetical protein
MGFFPRIQIYGFMSGSEQINYFFDLAYAVGKTTTCRNTRAIVTDMTRIRYLTEQWVSFLLFIIEASKAKFSVSENVFFMWRSITLRSKVPPTDSATVSSVTGGPFFRELLRLRAFLNFLEAL